MLLLVYSVTGYVLVTTRLHFFFASIRDHTGLSLTARDGTKRAAVTDSRRPSASHPVDKRGKKSKRYCKVGTGKKKERKICEKGKKKIGKVLWGAAHPVQYAVILISRGRAGGHPAMAVR
jgi:hypothetical protein